MEKWFRFGKSRRKDKETGNTPPPSPEKPYLEDSCLRARVLDTDFDTLVKLPPSMDLNEWLATHTVSFFHHVNHMYGVVSAEFCTQESCPSMLGPDQTQHLHWHGDKGKKVRQSAPLYIDQLMSWVQKAVSDDCTFPTKFGQVFPADFPDTVRKIQRHLFHVLAHLYHCHYGHLLRLGLNGHLNTLFAHFMTFTSHFRLLSDKDTQVLRDLHQALLRTAQQASPSSFPSSSHNTVAHMPEGPADASPRRSLFAQKQDPPRGIGDVLQGAQHQPESPHSDGSSPGNPHPYVDHPEKPYRDADHPVIPHPDADSPGKLHHHHHHKEDQEPGKAEASSGDAGDSSADSASTTFSCSTPKSHHTGRHEKEVPF